MLFRWGAAIMSLFVFGECVGYIPTVYRPRDCVGRVIFALCFFLKSVLG